MYELQKILKGTDELICWDRALVMWKKNLPGRVVTKFEKHWFNIHFLFAEEGQKILHLSGTGCLAVTKYSLYT